MMVWEYFTHFHKSALCYTGVHVYRATSPFVIFQVAHNAFDMIGGMVVHHNRHNYETLIKTLCHSGQYIRFCIVSCHKSMNHSLSTLPFSLV